MGDASNWRQTVVIPTETWINPFSGPVSTKRVTDAERAKEKLHALQTYLDTPEPAPSSTPSQAPIYRYSDHIHRDRILFLARDYLDANDYQDWSELPIEEESCESPIDHLPSITTLRLDVGEATPTPRRFNESGSTYISTRKRIKAAHAQALESFEKSRWSPPLPGVRQRTGPVSRNDGQFCIKGRALPPGRSFSGLPPLGSAPSRETTALHNSTMLSRVEKMGMMPQRITMTPYKLWRQKTDVSNMYRYLGKGSFPMRNS